MEKKMGNKNELFLSYNVLNLKTPSLIFSNLFFISRTLCPDYIYKISPKYGRKEDENEKSIKNIGKK
jgi:hypothetical protein